MKKRNYSAFMCVLCLGAAVLLALAPSALAISQASRSPSVSVARVPLSG